MARHAISTGARAARRALDEADKAERTQLRQQWLWLGGFALGFVGGGLLLWAGFLWWLGS